ncbi:MAG: PilZ domain-containing protein [Methanosarcinaceae archaeon]|nr:PilZ domain-containing protein [Methanosarcinaceae archaeon]
MDRDTHGGIKTGDTLDVRFSYDNKPIRTSGYVKICSDTGIVMTLDIDKKMTLPFGSNIYISGSNLLYSITGSKNFPEIEIKTLEEDKRGNARVEDILTIDYAKTPHIDYENSRKIFKDIFGELIKIPEIEDANMKLLYELLYQTSLQVNRILDILKNQEVKQYKTVEDRVNISGSGIRFIADQDFLLNDTLALRIFLPLASQVCVHVFGRVTASAQSGTQGGYSIAAKFVDIPETDRETIIKYVFKRQRELLRE